MPRTHTLRDVIQKGSCCRKGGDVELIATINPGKVPRAEDIALIYDPIHQAKGFEWQLKPFKGSRIILKYVGGDKDGQHFILDGRFSNFLQSGTKTPAPESVPYDDSMEIIVGQVWSIVGGEGPHKLLIRSEARNDSFFLSFSATILGEDSWVASDHPTSASGLRSSLAANNGRLTSTVL